METSCKLEEILKSKPEGEHLLHNLENIRRKAEPLLFKIVETFPDYTTHDINHSIQVLKNYDFIIPDSLKQALNQYEIYFLIAATYLHDIGMVNFDELSNETLKNLLSDKDRFREYMRDNHHLRSEGYILMNFENLLINDQHQATIIGRICRGHRKENLNDKGLFDSDFKYKHYSINIPLLSDFLRIADELDLTFERIPMTINEYIKLRETIEREEWEKHFSISGVAPSEEDSLIIKCTSNCQSSKIHRALKSMEMKINEELDELPDFLHHYRKYIKDIPRKFIMKIEAKGYKPYEMKFSLQEKEIVNLLMGEKLYKRKEECLRELLKNALDTCRFRSGMLKKQGLIFAPEIVFEISPNKEMIIVNDNGVGMDENIIDRYFTKIGRSFYNSQEFYEKQPDFTPVSELGIGILSCFMIADRIVIETKTDESIPLIIEIDNISDYFIVQEGKRESSGTTVILFLKDSIKEEIDLEKEIRYYARHMEFPIRIRLSNGNEYIIIKDIGFENYPSILLSEKETKDFLLFSINIKEDFVDGIIAFLFEKEEDIGMKPTSRHRYGLPSIARSSLSHEGIYINEIYILDDYIRSKYPFAAMTIGSNIVCIDLNLKGSSLNINVARNDIIKDEKFEKLMRYLDKRIINEFENILSSIEENVKVGNNRIISLFEDFFSNYSGISKFNVFEINQTFFTDDYIKFLQKFKFFKCISKHGFYYLRYNEILEKGKRIIVLFGVDYDYNENHLKEIFTNCQSFSEENIFILYEYNRIYKSLLNDYDSKNFSSFFQIQELYELKEIIPKKWKIWKFMNYKTKRFLEFSLYDFTILNGDHPFIKLLIKGKDLLTTDKNMTINAFFRFLKSNLRYNFANITTQQNEILKWFIDLKLIKKDEIREYLLNKEDFPP